VGYKLEGIGASLLLTWVANPSFLKGFENIIQILIEIVQNNTVF
jgi:hypothetical protein